MDIILDKIWQKVSAEKTAPMTVRLFRLICLTVYLLCICVVLPSNLFITVTLPQIVNYFTILLGLFALYLYKLSLKGTHLIKTLIIVGTLTLNPCWLYNGGMSGSVTYYYFVVALIPMVLCRSKERSALLAFIAINTVVLGCIQYFHPSWVTPYVDLKSQLSDYLPGVVECFAGLALVLWVVTTSYDREELAQRVASLQLSKSERNYRGVVENASCVILSLTPDLKISFLNKFGEQLFGWQREELIGQYFTDTLAAKLSEEGRRALLDSMLSAKEASLEEVEMVDKTGEPVWISWVSQAVYGETGLIEVLCVGTNVTERLKHSKEMQHVQRLESLGLLAGGIAHDYNNLLTAIMGYVSLTKMVSAESEEVTTYMNAAEAATVHAKALTSQLLTFAKGGQPIKTATSLTQLLQNSINLSLHGKACQCVQNIAPNLCWVEADAAQLTQVFNNLLLNAWQAMPPGRKGTITVSAVNSSNLLEVKITDTGSGISAKNLTHIFDPYFTTKKTGTGLGLAVVYSIVKHHGGNITVESVEDQGTTFTVTLPAIPAPLAEKTKGTTKTAVSTKKGRLLIMDDEPSIRQLATIILGRSGFSITAVSDGKDVPTAYQAALNEGNPYDLVILDLTVPGGTGGLEALGLLLKINPKVNAVVSSGYSDDMGSILKTGFKGVIPKPYTADQLTEAVTNLLTTL